MEPSLAAQCRGRAMAACHGAPRDGLRHVTHQAFLFAHPPNHWHTASRRQPCSSHSQPAEAACAPSPAARVSRRRRDAAVPCSAHHTVTTQPFSSHHFTFTNMQPDGDDDHGLQPCIRGLSDEYSDPAAEHAAAAAAAAIHTPLRHPEPGHIETDLHYLAHTAQHATEPAWLPPVRWTAAPQPQQAQPAINGYDRAHTGSAQQHDSHSGNGHQPQQMQQPVGPDAFKHARKLTSKLQDCNTWHQVVATLRRYAVQRGALGTSPQQMVGTADEALAAGHDPAALLQALNPRHLVVLWCTLARVMPAQDQQPVGVFRPPPQPHSQQAASEQPDAAVAGAASTAHAATGANGGAVHAGGAASQGSIAAAAAGNSNVPLSRVDGVTLRRLLSRLERLSWKCMGDGSWQATDAISMLWAMGHLRHRPSGDETRWLEAFTALTLPELPSLGPRHLSNALWALATLGLPAPEPWLAAAVQRGLQLAAAEQLTPSGRAVLVWSVARVAVATAETQPPQPAAAAAVTAASLAALLSQAVRQPDSTQPHHVSMMLWAVGHLMSADHPAVAALHSHSPAAAAHQPAMPAHSQTLHQCVAALWERAQELGPSALGPQGTANVLWAIARIQRHGDRNVSLGGQEGGGAWRQAVVRFVDAAQDVLHHMAPQQLYSSVWALAVMQVTPRQPWVHAMLVAARAKLDSYDPQGLSGLLWACCQLGIKPGPTWMAAVLRAADHQMAHFTPHSVALLLWSLAALGFNPGLTWAKALTQSTARLVPAMDPRSLAMCLHALARLRLPAHPTWSKATLARLKQLMQPAAAAAAASHASLQPAELSACLQGAARLGLKVDAAWCGAAEQVVLAWLRQAGDRNGQYTDMVPAELAARQLAGCLYGLARLGHSASDTLCHAATAFLVQHVSSEARHGRGSKAAGVLDLSQACWALAVMGHTPSKAELVQLAAAMQGLLPHMGHAELAQCAWALQRMGLCTPDPIWLHALLHEAERRLCTLVNGQEAGAHGVHDRAAPEPVRLSAPLLSVATLLRAVVVWGCTAVPGPQQGNGTHAVPVTVPQSFLRAAAAVIDIEASRRLYTSEGPLPNTGQILGRPAMHAAPPVLHIVAGVSTESETVRVAPNGTHIAASAAVVSVVGPLSLPYSYESGRLAALAAADAGISRKAARRRLWRGHRMYVLQHSKVLDASRRALQQLVCGGSVSAPGSGHSSVGVCGVQAASTYAERSGHSVTGSHSSSSGEEWDGWPSQQDVHCSESLGDEGDLRFMPW